jgi:sulfate adenylyltransferase
VRTEAIAVLAKNYFVPSTIVQAGYPLDMRYAGPREALLHALFRQNYGCSHLIVGRDHAGVGSYYGPFEAHHIFDEIPKGALETQPLKIDWTFWCYRCGGMASARTCPHEEKDRLLVSGTKLRKWLSEGDAVPAEFSRPEVLEVLRRYYAGLKADERVEVKLAGHSAR